MIGHGGCSCGPVVLRNILRTLHLLFGLRSVLILEERVLNSKVVAVSILPGEVSVRGVVYSLLFRLRASVRDRIQNVCLLEN